MIVISEPKTPKNLVKMQPETLSLDAGFSDENYKVLLKMTKASTSNDMPKHISDILEQDSEPDFYNFFALYDYMITQDRKIRLALPEIGYSPYNFLLLITCLGQDKKSIAELIDFSFSKVSANTAIRNSDHFMPMVGSQWKDFIAYFMQTLKLSDKKYRIKRNYSKVFYMLGERQKALKIPK